MANKMKEVAHLLGVELGEEFSIKRSSDSIKSGSVVIDGYYINKNGLFNKVTEERKQNQKETLGDLLYGNSEIVKLPFKPKYREKYWSFNIIADLPEKNLWLNHTLDYSYWKLGNCFRTKEEAETKGKELMESIVKEYKGGEQ